MIPISDEDKACFDELIWLEFQPEDGMVLNGTDVKALYRIAKAAIEFNKTAVPVFHIAEEDKRALENADLSFWCDMVGCPSINAAVHVATAALEASRSVNNNAPKLTDINWAGLCDEKVWEDMFATGHLGAKTRGKTIAAEFQKCRDFAFSRPVVASVDDAKERELQRLKEKNNDLLVQRDHAAKRANDLLMRIHSIDGQMMELQKELATLKEQANKPRVIRRF